MSSRGTMVLTADPSDRTEVDLTKVPLLYHEHPGESASRRLLLETQMKPRDNLAPGTPK